MDKKLIIVLLVFMHVAISGGQERPYKVGLVLSGGGAKGLAHIGVLKVLEELNIPVDYIGGTSMGSVVGGLYAIGYSAEEIEEYALSRDWDALLGNTIARSNLSIAEKREQEKYIFSFPADSLFDINLPGGLSSGQNVSLMLSNMIWEYQKVNDFSTLPVPFFCNATNLETGEQVVLDTGNLVQAIRASIAIPTLLTPVEIHDQLLFDGGIVNNFPVDEMNKRGVDIIIGVNLGFTSYNKEELRSIGNIIEQALFIHAYQRNLQNQKLCDVLISPRVQKMSAAGFGKVPRLIAEGEAAARMQYEKLQAIADSLPPVPPTPDSIHATRKDTIYLTNITLKGVEQVSESLVEGKLKLEAPAYVTVHEIDQAISRMYGSQFFHKVTYQLAKRKDGTGLIIQAEEKSKYLYRIGGHYDKDFRSAVLLNATISNPLLKGAKFNFDLVISEFQKMKAEYLIYTGWKPGQSLNLSENRKLGLIPDIGFAIENQSLEIPEYHQGRKTAIYDYQKLSMDLYGFSNISNNFSVGTGLKTDMSRISEEVVSDSAFQTIRNSMLNAYAYYLFDSFDKTNYPSRGRQINARAEFATDVGGSPFRYSNLLRLSFQYRHAFSLNKKFTLIDRFFSGTVIGPNLPNDYLLFFGGMNKMDFNNIVIPFVGLEFLEVSTPNALVAGMDLQYQPFKNHFFTLKGNLGKEALLYENLFTEPDVYYGTGITYGYQSFVGPIELTLMHGSNKGLLFYFNMGYWF